MINITRKLVKFRIPILIIAFALLIPSGIGFLNTKINYDILYYLPKDIETMKGQDILLEDFGKGAYGMFVCNGLKPSEVQKLKEEVEQIDHVAQVICFDSITGGKIPKEMLPDSVKNIFYSKNGDGTLMFLFFDTTTSQDETMDAIMKLRLVAGKNCFLSSMSAITTDTKNMVEDETIIYTAIAVALCVLVLIITTYYYFAGVINFEAIIILELYAAVLYSSMVQISELNGIMMVYKNSLKSIFDILSNKNYSQEKFGSINELYGEGDLIIKNLSFALGNRRMILDNINFEVTKNSRVAIVDQGGTSKPILLKLLLRQYEPCEGRIMIDDVNIRDLSEKALRNNIMLASENTFILDDTLEANIKIVKPQATVEEVVSVLKMTNILSWFGDITMGEILNTKLGEDGMILSEAKKQLISIARILLVSPKIVILEEPQSDISAEDTYMIKNAIDKITNSTILIFSERISSISVCDEIITLSPTRYGSSVTKDVIRDRNLLGFVSSNLGDTINQLKNIKNVKENNYIENYDDIDVNAEMQNIKKLNMNKGAKNNEEHRIFSQIW